jgi:hypothetical protein
MRQNLDLGGFSLTVGEMGEIDALDTGRAFNIDAESAIKANMKMEVPY